MRKHVQRAQSGRSALLARRCSRRQALRAGHVPVPLGFGPARRSPARIHRYGRLRALPSHAGPQCPAHPRYDAFGLPAEQYAVQTGTHPRTTTESNIANMKRQLRRLGLGHDERRSLATTDVDFSTGRSGSSCRSMAPGTTRKPARRVVSPSWKPSSIPVSALWKTDASGLRWTWPRRPRFWTRTALSTSRIRWSTGAPVWVPSWPTRKSPPTVVVTAETSQSSVSISSSG